MGNEAKNQTGKRKVVKTRSGRSREKEFTLYGWNACMRLFENRPQDIFRVFFSKERSRRLSEVKKYCRSKKLPYRQLPPEDLMKVAASVHHEGVVMVVRPLGEQSAYTLLQQHLKPDCILVALDQIENTHNVGAILRSCSYFGVAGMIMSPGEKQALVTSSAARVAEGGLEFVSIYECTDLPSLLRDFKSRTISVIGADPEARHSLFEIDISFPCVVALGNEREGLSPRVKKRCDHLVRVPGEGNMQSLNVSVGAGIMLAELQRRKLNKKAGGKQFK